MGVFLDRVGLTYQSPEGELEALREVSFAVEDGAFVSIVGPSGCGKSTLLGIVAGLESATRGRVTVNGQEVNGPSPMVGYMPQKDQLFGWRSVAGNTLLGPEIRRRPAPEVGELLTRYGLADFAGKPPGQLSGGMRQRAALIRTMATGPGILLLDEPFSALDYQTRLAVSDDIAAIIRREGKTALLVTHDIGESVSMSDRVVVLSKRPGQVKVIVEMGELLPLSPMARRDHPLFREKFNAIWKELELHV